MTVRMSLERAFHEYLRKSRLTQRRAGYSDNNKAGKAPYPDASTLPGIGSIFAIHDHPMADLRASAALAASLRRFAKNTIAPTGSDTLKIHGP